MFPPREEKKYHTCFILLSLRYVFYGMINEAEIKQILTHLLHSLTQIGGRNRAESEFNRFQLSCCQVVSLQQALPTKHELNADTVLMLVIFYRISCQSAYYGQYLFYRDCYIIFIYLSSLSRYQFEICAR